MADPRFDTSKDPRFKRVPQYVSRVGVDKRFSRMFEDKGFAEPPKVDPRSGGQVKKRGPRPKKQLREFYHVVQEDAEEGAAAAKQGKQARRGRRRAAKKGEAEAAADDGIAEQGDAGAGADGSDEARSELASREAQAADSGDEHGRPRRRRAAHYAARKPVRRRAAKRGSAVGADANGADDDEAGSDDEAVNGNQASSDDGEAGDEDDANDDDNDDDDDGDDDDDDDTDDETSEDDSDEEPVDDSVWNVYEQDVPRGDATRRLAVMRCDWDQINAGDLLVMLRTYLSSKEAQKGGFRTGAVERVRVFPSNYGLQRMLKEEQSGPLGEGQPVENGEAAEEDEGHEDDPKVKERMRSYQVERTKYFYAVADCDSAATASWLYDQMDGLDSDGISPVPLDLRFVPDDTEFPHAPHSEATELPRKYQGPAQTSTAVGHSNVKCTWDVAPASRKRDLMRKKFTPEQIASMDLSIYLATSSESEEEPQDAEALRSLVRDGDSESDLDDRKEEMGEMEATFSLEADKLQEEITERVQKQTEKVHTLTNEEAPKSTWQVYLDRKKAIRKERKAKARAERMSRREEDQTKAPAPATDGGERDGVSRGDLELMAEGESDDRGFNLRGSQRAAHAGKRNKHATIDDGSFRVDVDDPRIAKVFSSADFEIDPTNPQFRRTDGMRDVLKKKRQKKASSGRRGPDPVAANSADKSSVSAAPKQATGAGSEAPAKLPAVGGTGLQLFARRERTDVAEAAPDAKAPAPKKRKLKQG